MRKLEQLSGSRRRWLFYLRCGADPEFFARQVLAEHCRLPFAPCHHLLFQWHETMGKHPLPERQGLRFAMAAPRGSAKSTVVSLVLALHDIVFERERYILLLSATERQARQRLKSMRGELERGEAARLVGGRERHFTDRTITVGNVRVDAFGAGTEIRGISSHAYRPTKIILDDAEASTSAQSAVARLRLSDWFSEVVEHLGDSYTHLIAIGTVLHEKGLIASLLARPDFTGQRVASIISFAQRQDLWGEWKKHLLDFADADRRKTAREFFSAHREEMEEGASVLWPEKEDYEKLITQLTLQGRRAFYQEKQNLPLGPEDALFDAERALHGERAEDRIIIKARGPQGLVPVRSYEADSARRFGYLDAAMGKGRRSGGGDFAALAVVLLLPDGSLLLERLVAKRMSPTDQVALLFDQHAAGRFEALSIEGTGFQELLTLPIEDERKRRIARKEPADIPVQVMHPIKSKAARIGSLEPLISCGRLALGAHLDEEFWEELSNYPRSRHDDALDAAAGAVEVAQSAVEGRRISLDATGGKRPRVVSF